MTDAANPVLVPAQGDQPQIVKLGTVAAQNIALTLNLAETHVATIERAIEDEINAMSAHFTLAFADIRDQYELDVAKIKATFSFVNANVWKILGAGLFVFVLGVVVGHFA